MFCTKCGNSMPDASIFCGSCGAPMQIGDASAEGRTSSHGLNPNPPVQQIVVGYAGQLTCPKCGSPAVKGSFQTWQIIVSICFFPIGLLSLLAGRSPSRCHNCGYMWQV